MIERDIVRRSRRDTRNPANRQSAGLRKFPAGLHRQVAGNGGCAQNQGAEIAQSNIFARHGNRAGKIIVRTVQRNHVIPNRDAGCAAHRQGAALRKCAALHGQIARQRGGAQFQRVHIAQVGVYSLGYTHRS
ncbi:MAG: hypothetical protein BWY09_02809 [Candidatus Hydrogenedentes bacterium ADurb.Bin179]|nr:MAG: hypothetical protein BWY09_02809 [Candidatus Hydrogenedentes bacterium ADurb.Bin179]